MVGDAWGGDGYERRWRYGAGKEGQGWKVVEWKMENGEERKGIDDKNVSSQVQPEDTMNREREG